jgi:transglutaminase-like putative cysteine protease
MRYDISLSIDYAYDHASDHARSLLRVMPRHIPGRQDLLASLLTVAPHPSERSDLVDFFGNPATWIAFHEPIERIRIVLKSRIDVALPKDPVDPATTRADLPTEIAAARSIGPLDPHHFCGTSPRVSPSPDLTAYAEAKSRDARTVLEAVQAIGTALQADIEFDAEATDVQTAPETAFRLRRGVCQDFSHVMIACLRGIGIPAGYVSGFLRTDPPPGQARLEGADAMHAWVRAWCGARIGWVEFDPTNAIFVGASHVVVAYGRDYADVSPVRGAIRSAGGQGTTHSVDVVEVGS